MKQSNIFKPTLIFSQKTSVSIFVLFVYDMNIVVDSLSWKVVCRFVFLNKSSYKKKILKICCVMFAKYNITVFFILHDLSPYEKCQNFVLIRQLIRDLQTNGFNATSF